MLEISSYLTDGPMSWSLSGEPTKQAHDGLSLVFELQGKSSELMALQSLHRCLSENSVVWLKPLGRITGDWSWDLDAMRVSETFREVLLPVEWLHGRLSTKPEYDYKEDDDFFEADSSQTTLRFYATPEDTVVTMATQREMMAVSRRLPVQLDMATVLNQEADMSASQNDLLSDPLLESVPIHEGYKVLGGVVLYQKLGQGGMGAVYRGKRLRLGADVALKVMAPPTGMSPSQADNFIQRFFREARVAAFIRHQNLVRVHDVGTEVDVHFLVMDYIDGESAAERLKRRGRLSEREAVEICLGAADGLARAHEEGIVHRDVKPDNILVDKHGDVVVADLGLAKAFEGGEGGAVLSMGLSVSHQAMGTPAYMSPEQTKSAKDVRPPTDVWSLGVTLYELATGNVPYTDDDLYSLVGKIREDPIPDPKAACPGISDSICAIIGKSLQKNPAARFRDCGEMACSLRRHIENVATGSTKSLLADARAGTTTLPIAGMPQPSADALQRIRAAIELVGHEGTVVPTTVTVADAVEKRLLAERLMEELHEFRSEDLERAALDVRVGREVEKQDPRAALERYERAHDLLLRARAESKARLSPWFQSPASMFDMLGGVWRHTWRDPQGSSGTEEAKIVRRTDKEADYSARKHSGEEFKPKFYLRDAKLVAGERKIHFTKVDVAGKEKDRREVLWVKSDDLLEGNRPQRSSHTLKYKRIRTSSVAPGKTGDIEAVAEKLLSIFRKYNVAAGQRLMFQHYNTVIIHWTPPDRRLVPTAWNWLVEQGYVESERAGGGAYHFRLTELGEGKVYD